MLVYCHTRTHNALKLMQTRVEDNLRLASNFKSHDISQTAYPRADGNLPSLRHCSMKGLILVT